MQLMKRLIQFVAASVIALLAVQPALAGVPCTHGVPVACAPGCPMAMSNMAPDCPMNGTVANQMTATDCPQNCCTHALLQPVNLWPASVKLKFAAPTPAIALPAAISTLELASGFNGSIQVRSASPPLRILLHVFRI